MNEKVTLFPSAQDAAAALARRIVSAIGANPRIVLGLPTGRTPLALYRELVRRTLHLSVDWSRVTTFNLDELCGLSPDDLHGYRRYMQKHLFGPVGLKPEQVNFLNGAANDLTKECERYEAALRTAGGIDLQILGIGENGHIGFNEPAATLVAHTHRAPLMLETRRANAFLFGGHVDRVPQEGITMGVGTILQARSIVLLATGYAKAASVERMIRGPVTTWLPASFLQLHEHVEVMLDEEAAEHLTHPVITFFSSSRMRGSMSSPMASRTASCD